MNLEDMFAKRITTVPRSFIREILKVSLDPEIISFAGGLPNKNYFPVEAVRDAADQVFATVGADALQYSNSEGLRELRELIADRYRKRQGLNISPDSILITNGSQQGLDLLGKVLLNPGDAVLIEEPGYLGAIQSLSVYQPAFHPVAVGPGGIDTAMLEQQSLATGAKLLYAVPNFQNPSGVTYSDQVRRRVAVLAESNGFLIVEDDPYGELRFAGAPQPPIYHHAPERTVLLGSFSKTVAPGFRLGWLVAPQPLYGKLLVAKQASDLHTSSLNQYLLCQYLRNNDLDDHVRRIIEAYGRQCRAMVAAAGCHLPAEVRLWEPEGGMFLWGELPSGMDAMRLFEYAVREKVVFVPGAPFFTNGKGASTFRLNYSCSEPEAIERGMERLGRAFAACVSAE